MRYPRHNTIGQRQHTNPRARLKLWEAPGLAGQIWCFSKQPDIRRRIYRQPIASATVLRSIWTDEDAERLNNEVEKPAEEGLAHLVGANARQLSESKRRAVSRYLVSLYRRGWQELAAQPERVQPAVRYLKQMIDAASHLTNTAKQAIKSALDEQSKRPPGAPFPIDEVNDVLSAMRWTVLQCTSPSFVTGDSPLQIVPHVIVNRTCEVSLALSPTRALVCDWGIPQPWTASRTATAAEILEVNRRTALGANCFVYFPNPPSIDNANELLEGRSRRLITSQGVRRVPRKHRQTMEINARRIMFDEIPSGNSALIKELEEAEARGQLVIDDGDSG